MKIRTLFFTLALGLFALPSVAANLTITVPTNQVARVQAAVGIKLNLTDAQGNPRTATAAEVSQFLADDLRVTVREVEQAQQAAAAKAAVTDITSTGS